MITRAAAEEGRAPIYFQDPDGKPSYSLTPKKTPDGRDYRAVPPGRRQLRRRRSGMPLSAASAGAAERKIKYYRNPMGLPDTSPTPKKDSMGMDYIPVFEGEDSDDGSVKLSPGKFQRTGVVGARDAARDPHAGPRARHHPARRAPHLRDRDADRELRRDGRRCHHRARSEGPAA